MIKKVWQTLRPALGILVAAVLIWQLALDGGTVLAARSGGRVGGGSFSRPVPSRSYSRGGGYGAPTYGGGFGFPFLIPFFGFGGGFGGLFTLILFFGLANFLVSSFRRFRDEGDGGMGSELGSSNPAVSLNVLHVGLTAQARELQADLNRIGLSADTSSASGLTKVLQESTLALLRHPDYWVYAASEEKQTKLLAAETQFNQLALAERSKLSAETLSNYRQELRQTAVVALSQAEKDALAYGSASGEYIVVTLIVASEGKFSLPKINSSSDLRQALQQLGGISSDRLLAVELLWQPQAMGDTLTADEVLLAYPQLKLV
ncbi:DUF1517 domain-containing protein [Synechococcus sp. PCC 6312]|uniref:DUF1517 domain-containing protein n=1 Tax=Synechococcus sp. (strain ATCC 27167 / PCC 6312) TaxID=195253 RepID=UPI00031C3FAB|nr:DUF1517 domain-containing protein [Synechococcus sp. PCC 6312]